jgi:uncharacterized protein (TIGR02246 family)
MHARIFGLAVLLVCACEPARTFTSDDDAAIRAVLAAQADAWNAGDLDGFMAGYEPSESLVFTSGGEIHRGFRTTRDRYADKYFAHGRPPGRLSFQLEDIRALGPDAAVVLGRYAVSDLPLGGHGVFTLVAVRTDDGQWRIVHDHTSASE